MKVLLLYQDIQSGAKIATESLISAYRKLYPSDELIIYKQPAQRYPGAFSFLRNTLWSVYDFRGVINNSPDIDVIVSAFHTFALAWKLSSKRRVPAIFQIHGDQRFRGVRYAYNPMRATYHKMVGWLVSAIQIFALKTSTKIAFVSPAVRREFLYGIGESTLMYKSFILPNGVDISVFYPKKKSVRKNAADRVRVTYVGRMDEKKGIHKLVEAIGTISHPVVLTVAYPAPTDEFSRRYLRSLRLRAKNISSTQIIRFVENTKHISTVYQNSDFLVLPSQQEMFPLVILEAMACGVIPIATNVGGVGDILRMVSPELIIPSQDPSDIRKKIVELLTQSASARLRFVARGIEVANRFTWQQSAKTLHRHIMATRLR